MPDAGEQAKGARPVVCGKQLSEVKVKAEQDMTYRILFVFTIHNSRFTDNEIDQ